MVGAQNIGQQIYFNECTDDIAPRDGRYSRGTGSAAMMSFYTQTRTLTDHDWRRVFFKTILGGWDEFNGGRKYMPLRHPYAVGLYAKDIVAEKFVSIDEPGSLDVLAKYNVGMVTISFESVPYGVGERVNGPNWNANWMEITTRATNARVSVPVGYYKFTTGLYSNPPARPAISGNFLVQPQNYISLIVQEVPRRLLFGANAFDLKPVAAISNSFGKINSQAFAGYSAGTLLFDSLEAQSYTDYIGNQLYQCKLNFVANEWGWNRQPDPNGDLQSIGFYIGGAQPFTNFNIVNVINTINP